MCDVCFTLLAGHNRLGGSSLLDCVVFGRQSGKAAAVQLTQEALAGGGGGGGGGAPGKINVEITPGSNSVTVSWSGAGNVASGASTGGAAASGSGAGGDEEAAAAAAPKTYTMDEVAKHAAKDDCWVVVNGDVYDVTGS